MKNCQRAAQQIADPAEAVVGDGRRSLAAGLSLDGSQCGAAWPLRSLRFGRARRVYRIPVMQSSFYRVPAAPSVSTGG